MVVKRGRWAGEARYVGVRPRGADVDDNLTFAPEQIVPQGSKPQCAAPSGRPPPPPPQRGYKSATLNRSAQSQPKWRGEPLRVPACHHRPMERRSVADDLGPSAPEPGQLPSDRMQNASGQSQHNGASIFSPCTHAIAHAPTETPTCAPTDDALASKACAIFPLASGSHRQGALHRALRPTPVHPKRGS